MRPGPVAVGVLCRGANLQNRDGFVAARFQTPIKVGNKNKKSL